MEAPASIEMAKRGETPFDSVLQDESKKAAQEVLATKTHLVVPDMLEMEPYYMNDVVKCDPHQLFCEMDPKACVVNNEYDLSALFNGKYFTEGCHLAAPGQEGMHSGAPQADHTGAQRDVSEVPIEDLRPICGEACAIGSLFFGFPSCLGCTSRSKFCCDMRKCSVLKCLPNPSADEDKRCCAICECQSYLIVPQTCCEGSSQLLCLDSRYAFPCTKNVPCIVNCCGLTCCADWGVKIACCKTVGELIPRLKPEA